MRHRKSLFLLNMRGSHNRTTDRKRKLRTFKVMRLESGASYSMVLGM
jgi:hypothetical protein